MRLLLSTCRYPVTLAVPATEAMALAEFLKRLGYEDCASRAAANVTYDGVSEADTIWAALLTLQRGLADAGYAPR